MDDNHKLTSKLPTYLEQLIWIAVNEKQNRYVSRKNSRVFVENATVTE